MVLPFLFRAARGAVAPLAARETNAPVALRFPKFDSVLEKNVIHISGMSPILPEVMIE
jgi:hypothetical protein